MARGSQTTRPARQRGRQAAEAGGEARAAAWRRQAGAAAQRLRASAPLRYLVARPTLSAGLLLGLFVLAYLWPVLLGGKMLSPLAVLYDVVPWQGRGPEGLHGFLNPLLSDIAQAHHPWNVFARSLIRQGTFPAWNPHVLAGVPFFANPQTVVLSPFSVPLWVLPLSYAVGLSAALKLWAAGFGAYLLVRELRLGFLPGLLAGVAYALCSFNLVWLTHESLPAVAAMLPWMLWLAERVLRRGAIGPAIGLAVVTAVAITGGHPGAQLHVLAATVVYVALRAVLLPDLSRPERVRRLTLGGGAVALGLALAAVMFVPELLSSHGTLGTQARLAGGQPGTRMPLTAIHSVAFPDWWGRPSALTASTEPLPVGAADQGGPVFTVNFNERTFYAGVVALLLALVAVVSPGGWRRKAPFAALGLLALGVVLRAPGLHWLVAHLPAFDVVQNQRAHVVFELAVAVLAAFGLEGVLRRPTGERRRLLVVLGALTLAVVAIATIAPNGRDVGDVVRHFATGADVRSDAGLQLTSVAWFLLLAGALGALLLAIRRRPQHATALACVLVLVAAADMLHFAHGYQPMAPASAVVPPRTPAIAYLQRHANEGRFVGMGTALTSDWGLTYGLDDIRGYDPPFPTLRYFHLWRLANPAQTNWQLLEVEALSPEALQVVSVLGARYVIAGPGVDTPATGSASHALRRVYVGGDATVFENPLAAPRALVPARIVVVGEADDAAAAVVAAGFDPRRDVVVERGELGAGTAAALGGGPPAHGSVRIVERRDTEVRLEATLDRRGVVALDESLTDGWSVTVDGRAARALHANDVMRGAVVPAGRHEIVWRYRVPGLRLGLLLSLLAMLGLAGMGVAVLRGWSRER